MRTADIREMRDSSYDSCNCQPWSFCYRCESVASDVYLVCVVRVRAGTYVVYVTIYLYICVYTKN